MKCASERTKHCHYGHWSSAKLRKDSGKIWEEPIVELVWMEFTAHCLRIKSFEFTTAAGYHIIYSGLRCRGCYCCCRWCYLWFDWDRGAGGLGVTAGYLRNMSLFVSCWWRVTGADHLPSLGKCLLKWWTVDVELVYKRRYLTSLQLNWCNKMKEFEF